jgi:hypothetical protein
VTVAVGVGVGVVAGDVTAPQAAKRRAKGKMAINP